MGCRYETVDGLSMGGQRLSRITPAVLDFNIENHATTGEAVSVPTWVRGSFKDASPPPEVDEDDWPVNLPEAEANDEAHSGEKDQAATHFINFRVIKAIRSSRRPAAATSSSLTCMLYACSCSALV